MFTANAIPAPQGPIQRVLERALERGIENAAERVLERNEGFGGRGRDYDRLGGNYGGGLGGIGSGSNYPIGGGLGSGSNYPIGGGIGPGIGLGGARPLGGNFF